MLMFGDLLEAGCRQSVAANVQGRGGFEVELEMMEVNVFFTVCQLWHAVYQLLG